MSDYDRLMDGLAGMLANVRDIRDLTEAAADDPRYVAYWRWLDRCSTRELVRERAAAGTDPNVVRGNVRRNACHWQTRMRSESRVWARR